MAKSNNKLASEYPVSPNCPQCGSTDYRRVKAETFVAFADDRICEACEVRYTPPTPLWGRIVFVILGIPALIGGATLAWMSATQDPISGKGMGGGLVIAGVIGIGFLYKAFSRR